MATKIFRSPQLHAPNCFARRLDGNKQLSLSGMKESSKCFFFLFSTFALDCNNRGLIPIIYLIDTSCIIRSLKRFLISLATIF